MSENEVVWGVGIVAWLVSYPRVYNKAVRNPWVNPWVLRRTHIWRLRRQLVR